jgi:uncharacterized protein YukE
MAILNFDYPKALRQASEIENVANSMRSLAHNGLENAYEAIANVWKGDSANVYLNHCRETKQLIINRAGALDALATRIRKTARIIEDAEQKALAAAATNSHSAGNAGGGSSW